VYISMGVISHALADSGGGERGECLPKRPMQGFLVCRSTAVNVFVQL